MKARILLMTLVGTLVTASLAAAAVESGADFLAEIQQRVESGVITAEQALLLKFHYAFDREQLPADLLPADGILAPLKCGTPLIVEYRQMRGRLADPVRNAIEAYIAPPAPDLRLSYFSPSGNFRLYYETSGPDAPPLADENGDGVPDFVERCAEYLDTSWDVECVAHDFEAPPLDEQTPYMSIYFEALQGVYGYTAPGAGGMTSITLDNDFLGFPPNDDPDGDQLGAAKVTCAHEFKHSSQYAGSRWNEGDWVELDATWCEELVFPATNDYYTYVVSGSPISHPATPLDSGGSGSYEDCVWQLWMSQTWTPQIITDLWRYRTEIYPDNPSMMLSYDHILQQYGSTVADGWGTFTLWNYATGVRAVPPFGYDEAGDFPTGSPQAQFLAYPNGYSGAVDHLAANFIRSLFVAQAGKRFRIAFDGVDGGSFTLAVNVRVSAAGGGGSYQYDLEPDANNDGVFVLPVDLEFIYSIGIVIGNPDPGADDQGYAIDVDIVDPPTAAPEGEVPAFAITGNFPNPFNPATAIRFSLDRPGEVALRIFDVQGRRIRTLGTSRLDAGRHELTWDGRDDAGRALPSGTYFAKLTGGGRAATHKLVLAK